MNFCRTTLIILAALPFHQAAAQAFSEKDFDHFTTREGLSHNTVTGITQDSAGYIWLATSAGLNRYNGSQFVQFHSARDNSSMASEDLHGVVWLDKTRLAVHTAGLHILNTKTGERRNLVIPYRNTQYMYKFNMLVSVMGDDDGSIYILSRSGFYHFDKNCRLVSRFDYYSDSEVFTEHFYFGRDLFKIDDRYLLIVAVSGLYRYDRLARKVKKMTRGDIPAFDEFLEYPKLDLHFVQPKPGILLVLKKASDTLIYVDVAGRRKVVSTIPFSPASTEIGWRSNFTSASDTVCYLTGHNSGFFKLTLDHGSGKVTWHPEKYFPAYLCNSLLEDHHRKLWIGTNKGLFHQNPHKSNVQTAYLPPAAEELYPDIRVDDIFVSGDKIYAGTRGGGVFIYDKHSFQYKDHVILDKTEPRTNSVRAIVPVDRTTLLFGTTGPLYLFDRLTNRKRPLLPPGWNASGDWTSDLLRDSKGNIWISSYNVYRYGIARKQFDIIPYQERLLNVPFNIVEDCDGNIWMSGHGLARYNTRLDSFDLLIDSFPFLKMMDKQVNALAIDNQNTIWFNSNNNGLTGYNIDKKTFRHFSRSDGLPNENIASLIIVDNKLWIACYSGIACMDLRSFQILSFGKEDGFPDLPVVKGARFYYDKELRQLYIGCSNAIARFKPDEVLRRKAPPLAFIENIVIGNRRSMFLPGKHISTSWRSNEIMITIGSINFSDASTQQFAYRIVKDKETPWQDLGSQPSFSISKLPPGDHRVQVKVFSANNRWPAQVKEISIGVQPPFWLTDWFLILSMASVPVLIYLLVRWRTGVARKKEMQKTHIQKLIADDYKSQFELEQISNYFSSSLSGKKTKDEVLWDVARNLIGRMKYVDCMMYLWNEDKTKMVQKAAYGPKGRPEFISAQVFDVLPGQGVVGHVVETMQPVLINDTRQDSRYRVDEEFRLSEICVPIIHNGELLGVIDSEHYDPGFFTERDIKILTTIATLIGNKLVQLDSEESLEAKREELANINVKLAEAQLSALQAQMNPHFVFNALNSIKRMILDGDNERASRYLSKFALMIRMTLNHSKDTFVTLDENIAYIKTYLEMEQLRFHDSFSYHIFTGENIDSEETVIPSMMIQPLVENAIWHGLLPSGGEKKITIGFTQEENKITCSIEDNGIGIRQSEKLKGANKTTHQSVGLENIQKRIRIINEKYDMNCTLEVADLRENGTHGQGTRVLLRFNAINI